MYKAMLSVLDFNFYNGDDNGITNAKEMNKIISGMYNDSSPVVSTLMYDVQYDAIVQWISETHPTSDDDSYEIWDYNPVTSTEYILLDPILIKKCFSEEDGTLKYNWTRVYLDDVKSDPIYKGQGLLFAVSGLNYLSTVYNPSYNLVDLGKISGNINNIADFNSGTCCMTQGIYKTTEDVWDDNIEDYVSIDKELISLRGTEGISSSDLMGSFYSRCIGSREYATNYYNNMVVLPDMYTMSRAALYIK